jgi:hypothetical protein
LAVSDATVTTTTAANFIPTLWSDGVVAAAKYAAVIQELVNTDFQDDLKVGNTLDIPRLSNLSTQSKSSGVSNTINFEAITEGLQQITVSTHEYAAFMVEGVVQVQTNQDLRARYEKQIGYALARGREATLAALFQNLSTNVVGSYGTELTADDYTSILQKLGEAGALEDDPEGGDNFALILSWAAYAALMRVEQFTSRNYIDDAPANAFKRAKVGQILGLPVFRSNMLRSPATGQHDCAAFHREQFALIVQEEIPVQSQYLIRNLSDGVVGWNLYGTARVLFPPETPGGGTANDSRGVLVKST